MKSNLRKSAGSLIVCLALAALATGCASSSPPRSTAPEQKQEQEQEQSPQESIEPGSIRVNAPGAVPGRTASGQLVSADGQTTGRVEVALREHGEGDFGEDYYADVNILDLQTPFPTLGVRGAYWERQDDQCADVGFAGGDLELDDSNKIDAMLGASWTWGNEDWSLDPQSANVDAQQGDTTLLHEISLTRSKPMEETDGTTVDLRGCYNVVIAAAVLEWDPVS